MATVLITGGSGLIGRWVHTYWPASLEPVEVDHREHDLTDGKTFVDLIRAVSPDVVLHLAWCASGFPGYRDSPENVRWVEASASAAYHCMEAGIGFVATGTVVDSAPGPDAYSAAKNELRGRLSHPISVGAMAWVRPFYTFDPAARRPALVADCLAARDSGDPVRLRSPGSAHDFIHAADVGSAVARVLESRLTGVVDVGSGRTRTVDDLARACGARVEGPRTVADPAAGPVAETSALRALGWSPAATDEFFGTGQP